MTPRCALALDIGGTKLAAAVVEDGGRARRVRSIPTLADQGAEQALERALELAAGVMRDELAEGGRLVGLGVSTNGLTREAGVDLAPSVPGWSSLAIPPRLRERFPSLPVVTVNDVKAATVAELTWGNLRGADIGLYVNLGTGFAAGIVLDGEVVNGAHGAAGEVGYLVPCAAALAALRPGEAALEERIGGRAVTGRTASVLGAALGMAELVERAGCDPASAALLDELLGEMAMWIANLAVVLDPERVVLGGGMMRSQSALLDRVRAVLERAAPFTPEVLAARFGADSALLGAGAIGLRLEDNSHDSCAGPAHTATTGPLTAAAAARCREGGTLW
jgi:glucokinase